MMSDKKTYRGARIRISEELIMSALAIPEDAMIYDICRVPGPPGIFEFTILHQDLPEAVKAEGGEFPLYKPEITTNHDRKPSTWLSFEWGKPYE
jgi:hypothetical protein